MLASVITALLFAYEMKTHDLHNFALEIDRKGKCNSHNNACSAGSRENKEDFMKKLVISSLMLGTLIFVAPSTEAKTTSSLSASGNQQIIIQPVRGRRGRWYNRRTRVVTTTRVRWVGPYRYRETIRTTYFANGRTRTVVVSRVRLGGRRVYRNY